MGKTAPAKGWEPAEVFRRGKKPPRPPRPWGRWRAGTTVHTVDGSRMYLLDTPFPLAEMEQGAGQRMFPPWTPCHGKISPATPQALPWQRSAHGETFSPPVKRQGPRKTSIRALAFYWGALPPHGKKVSPCGTGRALSKARAPFTAGRHSADGAEGHACAQDASRAEEQAPGTP